MLVFTGVLVGEWFDIWLFGFQTFPPFLIQWSSFSLHGVGKAPCMRENLLCGITDVWSEGFPSLPAMGLPSSDLTAMMRGLNLCRVKMITYKMITKWFHLPMRFQTKTEAPTMTNSIFFIWWQFSLSSALELSHSEAETFVISWDVIRSLENT